MLYRIAAIAATAALLSPGAGFAAAPPPVAAASPAPVTALKVIANVRSTSRCAEIVTHANSAISSALNNDVQLQQLITRLRAINLDDGNPIHRRNGLDALGEFAKTLTKQSRAADGEVKRLRALAEKSTDPQEKTELKAFADALGGALWRQQKIARDLNGYLAAVDFQDMATFTEAQQAANRAVFGVPDPFISTVADTKPNPGVDRNRSPIDPSTGMRPPPLGHDINQATATQEATAAAKDFESRLLDITSDENGAAQHVTGALARC
ncbi:MAG TPA: hypothetical protein VFW34_04925 [Candidatus Rubrimentiphilum sp.]|nr:hypothetical protein [Candidatus Rubrimentiphilum sp.]